VSGVLVFNADHEMLESTLSRLNVPTDWMQALHSDLEAFQDAHPTPYEMTTDCKFVMLGVGSP